MTNISNERDVPQPRGNPADPDPGWWQLLERLDPETWELAHQISDRLDGLEKLRARVAELEAKVRDLLTVVEVFADAGKAETIIARATEEKYDDRYLAGYADGLAGRVLAAGGPEGGES